MTESATTSSVEPETGPSLPINGFLGGVVAVLLAFLPFSTVLGGGGRGLPPGPGPAGGAEGRRARRPRRARPAGPAGVPRRRVPRHRSRFSRRARARSPPVPHGGRDHHPRYPRYLHRRRRCPRRVRRLVPQGGPAPDRGGECGSGRGIASGEHSSGAHSTRSYVTNTRSSSPSLDTSVHSSRDHSGNRVSPSGDSGTSVSSSRSV